MKQIIIILLTCMFVYTNTLAADLLGSGVDSVGSDCLSGTYMSAWNGLYPADTDKACINSGASNKDGTQLGGTLTSGQYVVTTKDTYVRWANSANDMFDENEGTLWVEVNFNVGNTLNITFFEIWFDSSNNMSVTYLEATGAMSASRIGGGASDALTDVLATITKGNTVTIGMSWSVGRSGQDFAITVNKGSTWYDDGVDGIATMATAPTEITMGNERASTSSGQTVTYTNYAIQAGWETTCPW